MNETKQAEALKLAEVFERFQKSSHRWTDGQPIHIAAASELRRQHAHIAELEAENASLRAERNPDFDAISPEQEELAIHFCREIAGARGQKGRLPDPVRLLEMAEALYTAERDFNRSITGGSND